MATSAINAIADVINLDVCTHYSNIGYLEDLALLIDKGTYHLLHSLVKKYLGIQSKLYFSYPNYIL